jgi:hypothetical protein
MNADWEWVVDNTISVEDEVRAVRAVEFTDELSRTLGTPDLVTDPDDGLTRPSWTGEVPMDELERICRPAPWAIRGYLDVDVDDSEGGESD